MMDFTLLRLGALLAIRAVKLAQAEVLINVSLVMELHHLEEINASVLMEATPTKHPKAVSLARTTVKLASATPTV